MLFFLISESSLYFITTKQIWIAISGLSSKTRKSLAIVAKVLDGCSGASVKT